MLFQTMGFLEVLADIFGAILIFLKPIIVPTGEWMVDWITASMEFLKQNFSSELTIYIVIFVILIVSGVIINIIWPGDRPGTIFSKGLDKIDEKFEEKLAIPDEIRRCKDCGNPIGDSRVCPLCGAEND